jgi:lysophospholipase L1-like esterase
VIRQVASIRFGSLARIRALAYLSLLLGCIPHATATIGRDESWLGTWEAAPQLVEPRNMPPAPGLVGHTLRQVIHVSIGGSRWRVRLSNEFGDGPLTIAAAHIARPAGREAIDPTSDVALTFGGSRAIVIAAGSAVVSDPIDLVGRALAEITISLYIDAAPSALTGHPGSRTTSYLSPGNHVAAPTLPDAKTTEHWYVLSGLEVLSSTESAAIVVLGNSIADGRGSGTDQNDRWPDNLARRLQGNTATAHVAVLNAGIGGNAVLRGGLGPTGLSRLDRDVLAQARARWLIVSEGVNDIGAARGDSSESIARQLTDAYRDIIRRARARRMRVYGATILPFGGSMYSSPEHEAARAAVNAWIRQSGAFDAVIDLDAAMRDPANPARLRPDADSGDHLHPNQRGHRQMADAFDLALFTTAKR